MKSIPLKIAQIFTFIVLLGVSLGCFLLFIMTVLAPFSPEGAPWENRSWKIPVKMESKELPDQEMYSDDRFKPTKIEYTRVQLEVVPSKDKAFFQTVMNLAFLGAIVFALPFYYFLFHILASVETIPFSKENVSRIKKMGLLVIGGELYRFFLFLYLSISIVKEIDIQGFEIAPIGWTNLNFLILFLGIIILVIGEVFRQGFVLQENENLTV